MWNTVTSKLTCQCQLLCVDVLENELQGCVSRMPTEVFAGLLIIVVSCT